mgnify:CR=1 FL=1
MAAVCVPYWRIQQDDPIGCRFVLHKGSVVRNPLLRLVLAGLVLGTTACAAPEMGSAVAAVQGKLVIDAKFVPGSKIVMLDVFDHVVAEWSLR